MDSKTFYLKYRPQNLSELDLVEIFQGLTEVVKSGRVPHALLFTGPKGTGKTSAARILAKAVNCLKKKDHEPCNRCEICQEITNGTALDLIEIDAASNRGIDDIRSLKEGIRLSPVKCHYKVYIIDEVHMLTTEAFNALLKTLEEPPEHAIFILCTTAPEKIPQTIISRCLRFNFRKAKPAEIVGSLKRVVKGEKLQIEEGVLGEIAHSVDGSFRDAHKTLEQLSLGGRKVTLKATQELLGQIEELSPEKLLTLITQKDIKGAFREINRIVQVGGDLNVYLLRLLERLRQGLLAKVGLEDEAEEELVALEELQIRKLIVLFSRAYSELKFSPIPQLPLELVVAEWCENKSQISKRKSQNYHSSGNSQSQTHGTPNKISTQLKEVKEKWSEILTKIRPLNHSVEALLKASRPFKVDGQTLTLEVFYKFHKERLETEKCRVIVEEVASDTLGSPVKLKCVLGKKPARQSLPAQRGAGGPARQSSEKNGDILDIANAIFTGKIVS